MSLPPPQPSPNPSQPGAQGTGLTPFFERLHTDESGVLGLFVVLLLAVLLSYLLWPLAVEPTKAVNEVLPSMNCTGEVPGTSGMRTCATKVAAVKMVGPMSIALVVVLMRGRLARWIQRLAKGLHPGGRPLIAPLLATLLFLLVWAGAHTITGDQTGLLPQKMLPAVIGVFTYAITRYSSGLQRKFGGFFQRRDHLPKWVRVVIALGIPTAVSLLLTNQDRVSDTARKEQLVVLLGLVIAYMMLAPSSGDVAGEARRVLGLGDSGTARR
jgi:hypothetical protein